MDRRKFNGRKSTEDTRTAAIERLKEKATTRKYVYNQLNKMYHKKVPDDMVQYIALVFLINNRPDLIKNRWRDEFGRYAGVNTVPGKPVDKKSKERPRDNWSRFIKSKVELTKI